MMELYVLWQRQVKKYYRSKARMIGSLGQPLLFLIALGFGFGPMFAASGGGNYLQFITPGIIAMSILFSATFVGIEVIWDRQFGFLKEMLVAPVPRLNIMVGRTIGGATVSVFQGLIVLIIAMLFGFQITNIWMLPLALVAMFIIALLFTALGTALASTMQDMHAFQLIINFLLMPLFFLSGSLFPISGLPGPLGLIVQLNPLTYGVDALRGTLSGSAQFGLGFDFVILIAVSALFLFIGSYFFSKMQM